MNIQDACENKGTLPEFPNMYCVIVRHVDNKLSPWWYDAETDNFAREVSGEEALRTDWQSFPGTKEIRPEKAGELWRHDETSILFFIYDAEGPLYRISNQGLSSPIDGIDSMVHGKNWTRLLPEVEDENVETIEIEGVKWKETTPIGVNASVVFPDNFHGFNWDQLRDKPRMKMILVMAKDKHES